MHSFTKFIFVVLPEVHLLDLAGPDQVISEAIDMGANFKIEYAGIKNDINTSAGLGINRLNHFSKVKLRPGDFIILPGSRVKYILSGSFKKNTALFNWLTEAYQKKVNLVSICVGAFTLAETGLLNGLTCTTHFQLTKKLREKYPMVKVKENVLYVHENNIYTSAGIASGIDLMLHILEQLTDSYFAHKIARELVVYNRRDGIADQITVYFNYRNHMHSGIHNVQNHIIENISQKNHLGQLAGIANMSERNFTRIFKKETGLSVNEYITKVRSEKIKELKLNPGFSKKQIAFKVGLTSEKQVERLSKKIG